MPSPLPAVSRWHKTPSTKNLSKIRPLALAVVLRSGARGVRRDFGSEIARQPKMFKNGGQSFRCKTLHLVVLTLPYLPREKLRCLLVFDSLVREQWPPI